MGGFQICLNATSCIWLIRRRIWFARLEGEDQIPNHDKEKNEAGRIGFTRQVIAGKTHERLVGANRHAFRYAFA